MSNDTGQIDADDEVVDEVEAVPDDAADDWQPEGYEPGPDDPGPVDDECGGEL